MEKTGCKISCGAPTTLTVKGLMMMEFWAYSVAKLRHLANVCEKLTGFIGIWISSAEIYQVNELLAFILLMRSVDHFLFIHYMTFSLTWSYCRSIMASNFRADGVHIKKQICWSSLCS